MTTALVIPCCDVKSNNKDQLDNLLESIEIGGTAKACPIICCFDGCSEVFVDYFKNKYPFIKDKAIINEGNKGGFCVNSNKGLRYVHQNLESDAILCNQDTILPSWDVLHNITYNKGLCSTQTIIPPPGTVEEIRDFLDNEFSAGYTSVMEVPGNKFAGYCYYLSKELMFEIGYLYEPYIASFDDDDFTARALVAGFPVEISGVKCYHTGSHFDTTQTGESMTGAYTMGMMGLNLVIYRERFKVPFDIPHDQMINWITNHYKGKWEVIKPFVYVN